MSTQEPIIVEHIRFSATGICLYPGHAPGACHKNCPSWVEPVVHMYNGLMPEQMLMNLLAVIHRDGGHYTAQHGLSKSYEDAMELIPTERVNAEDTMAAVGVLCTPDYCVRNVGPKESA